MHMSFQSPTGRYVVALSLAATAFALAGCGDEARERGVAQVDQQRLEQAATEPGEWMSNGRTYDEQRFSPLADIAEANVGRLALTAEYSFPTALGQEATPIVVDGIMYVSSDWSVVHAFDAATGQLLWEL